MDGLVRPLAAGSLAPSRCARSSTLYVLIGDSIDRELVRSRCAEPALYEPQLCAKCVWCADECDAWLNVMHFGLGLYGCEHADRHWAPNEELQSVKPRIETLLGRVLRSAAAATYHRVVISLHSGAWDVLSTKECANVSTALLTTPSVWLQSAQSHLLETVTAVVAASPVARRVRMPMLWRTIPLLCRSFAGGEDASQLFAAVSDLGVELACRHRLTLVDWRHISCRQFNESMMLADGTHWQPHAYDALATELEKAAHATPDGACGRVPSERCECRVCSRFVPYSWRLGAHGPSCSAIEHSSSHHAVKAEAPQEAASQREAEPESEPRASDALAGGSCRRGPVPREPASIALFALAAYPSLSTPPWLSMTTMSWHANAKLLHVYVLAQTSLPQAWTSRGTSVVPLVVDDILDALLRFAGIEPSNATAAASSAGAARAPRAASFSPLLADFAASVCGVELSGYAFFGSIELDVVLGDLRPFVSPYHGWDAIALRWVPPNIKSWASADDAIAYNTLGDPDAGVSLSTPLLLLHNNASMRRLWWRAETWLRSHERSGLYSLRTAATCKLCTGPLYWFDEHGFPNFWRHQLTLGGSMRVAYVCCAFDDHHVGVGSTVAATVAAAGCVVEWAGGELTRTCPSAAQYAWDGGLAKPPPASRGDARACEDRDESAWPKGVRWTLGGDACARLERHAPPGGAVERATASCPTPAPSFGYDIGWHGHGANASASSVVVLGAGDSAGALLAATNGRCRGAPLTRTLAAFHAAKSKHVSVAHEPIADATLQLHPRFLVQMPRRARRD